MVRDDLQKQQQLNELEANRRKGERKKLTEEEIYIQDVELEASERGFEVLSKSAENKIREKVKKLVTFITDTDGVQDLIISENKPIVVKTRGVLSSHYKLDEWGKDIFNYFVWEVSKQGTPSAIELGEKVAIVNELNRKLNKRQGKWVHTKAVQELLEENDMSFDYSVAVGKRTLRIHIMYTYNPQAPDRRAITMNIRVNDTMIPHWDELNLPDKFKDMTKMNSGLVLIAGHVGAGKTTTAASALSTLNLTSDRDLMVLTIENPIEYVYKSETITFLQRNVGSNTPSFGKATDDAMRENADIVLIGELRTADEMDNALRLAEIGKLVIATIHSNSVADTPDRIINSFPGDVQDNVRARLMENVVCIMHQNLERVGDKQFPIVEGFLVRNQHDQTLVREAMSSRQKLVNFMQSAEHDWVVSHAKSFKELKERNAFDELIKKSKIEDIKEAELKLVPFI